MRSSGDWLLLIAMTGMLLALVCDNVTVATDDYRGVLLAALVGVAVADSCCAALFIRGRRWVALVIAMPSVYVVWDFARRAPFAFK